MPGFRQTGLISAEQKARDRPAQIAAEQNDLVLLSVRRPKLSRASLDHVARAIEQFARVPIIPFPHLAEVGHVLGARVHVEVAVERRGPVPLKQRRDLMMISTGARATVFSRTIFEIKKKEERVEGGG